MDRPIGLIPLVCLNCSTPIPAQPDEAAWVCANCGQGLALYLQKGLERVQVFFAAGIPAEKPGRPFWVVNGQASLQRTPYRGSEEQKSAGFWSQPRLFYLPAYSTGLDDFLETAVRMLAQPPQLQAGQPARFTPVTLYPEDILPAAEFIVMAIEAGRKDAMKKLDLSLKLSVPALWILP